MRYSESPKATVATPLQDAGSNRQFVEQVIRQAGREALAGALLFVGGNDPLAIALRSAQAVLRFDARPSLWSHVAVLLGGGAQPGATRGLEVTLDPLERALQVPERNGVTEFTLERYFDTQRYPNLALVTFEFASTNTSAGAAGLQAALRHPNRDRERFPLWSALAAWARYVYAPERVPNPLLEATIMPSAGLCEYAFEAAGVDLTPGATANDSCPELIWSTVNHWTDSIAAQATLCAYAVLRDEGCVPQPVLPLTFELEPARRPPAKRKKS